MGGSLNFLRVKFGTIKFVDIHSFNKELIVLFQIEPKKVSFCIWNLIQLAENIYLSHPPT
ncbi:hypothetical protein LFREDSHE_42950 [Shewanella baltica]